MRSAPSPPISFSIGPSRERASLIWRLRLVKMFVSCSSSVHEKIPGALNYIPISFRQTLLISKCLHANTVNKTLKKW